MSAKITIIFFFFVLLPSTSFCYDILSLAKDETLRSAGDIFELGFFQPGANLKWYLGIWLRQDLGRTSLWVANRDHPLIGSNGTLTFYDNNLLLFGRNNYPVWSTNVNGTVRPHVVVKLLDNGNLVLKDTDTNQFLWQSFDFPTDTLIPQMKMPIETDKTLRSWSSPDDPSSGEFWLEVIEEVTSFAIYLQGRYRFDVWNGYRFGDMPPIFQLEDDRSWHESQSLVMTTNHGNLSRLRLEENGIYQVYTWFSKHRTWNLSWSSNDSCFLDDQCGSYSFCSVSRCHCIKGFNPKLENSWSGCSRIANLSCSQDRFITLHNMKLPDDTDIIGVSSTNPQDCEKLCLNNCKCTAYALVEIRKGEEFCVGWFGELEDMRNYTFGGQDLHVRIAPTDVFFGEEGRKKETKKRGISNPWRVVLIIVGVMVAITVVAIPSFCLWKRFKRNVTPGPTQAELVMEEIVDSDRLQVLSLRMVREATDDFSDANKLGQGGFGAVYKGTLPDGREMAVKRLRGMTSQGHNEFRNEVTTILRVRHVNLVRLQGCCYEGGENILIYEYLENFSLDRYLFDISQSSLLNWATRFKIVKGIAEGLSYLHNFTTPSILHRDLKPSNVLLDRDMVPKISDFGLAHMLENGMTKADINRVVGTRGYMSEETARHGQMSKKSDVFSFGVTVLEIISGKMNLTYCNSNPGDSLLDMAWRQWSKGNGLQLVDPHFIDSSFAEAEALRCLQIGLLCVQGRVDDRPNTRSIVLMLENAIGTDIPTPTMPNYYYSRFLGGEASSSVLEKSKTFNENIEYTISEITPR